MLALSGLFFPVDRFPRALEAVAFLLPTTHAVALLQGVWDGSGWGAHWVNVAALLVLFAAYTALSTKVFAGFLGQAMTNESRSKNVERC